MKRIDLHMHTVATLSDRHFVFSKAKLEEYVQNMNLDAIAITNHNMFDATQYRDIAGTLSIPVFPGIEVDVESCHILVIADLHQVDNLDAAAQKITARITGPNDSMATEEFLELIRPIASPLIIPHYDKKPAIRPDTLEKLRDYITAGEVDSAKKFLRNVKGCSPLVPVLFSDARISENLASFPTRHTYIDCGELTLAAIKSCLNHHGKVALSEKDGNSLFQVLEDGLKLSTGLNVLLGDRSSGKTHILNRIHDEHQNTKYIRQFSLVQQDEATYEKYFNSELERQQSSFTEDYLSGFKSILDDIVSIDLPSNERKVADYLETLIQSAEEADRADAYSRASLFSETMFSLSSDDSLRSLIGSVRQLIENVDYRETIEKHVNLNSLRALACELIETLWRRALESKKKDFVNRLVSEIKSTLGLRSSAVQVADVDLYRVALSKKKVDRFETVVSWLRIPHRIFEREIQGFRIVAERRPYAGALDLRSVLRTKIALKNAMEHYEEPYSFLQELLSLPSIPDTELYKCFAKVTYQILNSDGFPVSGGERSEFRLLQEISDAQHYDILLIDEPESSFDNSFLKDRLNSVIREIAKTMPVIVVTHNNTVAITIAPDYLLFARKTRRDSCVEYKVFCGHPSDKLLVCAEGETTSCHIAVMNSLEAGQTAYNERRRSYEALEN